MQQLVSSPACLPRMTLEQILPAFAKLGFAKFEAFTSWCRSHLDTNADPAAYRDLAARHGMRFTSMHLPPVTDDLQATLRRTVAAARFAEAIGAGIVLFKADTRENYIRAARPFLDVLQREGINVTPVLQNHKGTAITTLKDFRGVIRGIDDPRMKTLLEVGHLQRVEVHWRQGWEMLGDSIALIHINDIAPDGSSVPYGTGEVDFPGLFRHIRDVGYRGDIVVELELKGRETDSGPTLHHLAEAVRYLRKLLEGQS